MVIAAAVPARAAVAWRKLRRVERADMAKLLGKWSVAPVIAGGDEIVDLPLIVDQPHGGVNQKRQNEKPTKTGRGRYWQNSPTR
jgi:hypothetical protein